MEQVRNGNCGLLVNFGRFFNERRNAMKRTLVWLSILSLVFFGSLAVYADTISVFNPDADTYIYSSHPDTNYGTATSMKAAGYGASKVLMHFDLSSIPSSATIIDAKLEVYIDSQAGETYFKIYRMLNDWSEGEATWNQRKSGVNWDNAGGDYSDGTFYGGPQIFQSDVGKYKTISAEAATELEVLVQHWVDGTWVNDGIAYTRLFADGTRNVFVESREAANPPKLTVTWVPEPATIGLLAVGALGIIRRR